MIKNDIKKRNWTFVLYDDSCSKDWEEYLISTGVPFAYAYHDKDITEIGEPKKPHYHVMCYYDNTTTKKNVKRSTEEYLLITFSPTCKTQPICNILITKAAPGYLEANK